MTFAHAVLFATLLGFASPASSAGLPKDYGPAEMRRSGFDDASLKKFIGQLDYADVVLPNITPEEDRYLTAESALYAVGTYR